MVTALVAVSLVVSGCASSSPASTASESAAKAAGHDIPAGQLGGAFTAASVGSAEHALAQSGIATVSDETSSTPIVAVTGPVRMMFTQAQVRGMALQAADGGGTMGSTLDSTFALPQGYPSFSYLLAAWVSTIDTAGATAVRTVMGPQTWTEAPAVIFPAIAMPLFVSDVIAATSSSDPAPTPSATAQRWQIGGAAAAQLTGFSNAPCTTVSNFIKGVLNTVINALMLSAPSGTGVLSKIGKFFVTLWNTALTLAQAVAGLLASIPARFVAAIQTVAAGVAVVAQIAAYLLPWSVKVTPTVQTVAGGDGGSVHAMVDAGTGSATYPAAVMDCANQAKITLPPLNGANLPAVWALGGAITASGATSVTLDGAGSSSIDFTTKAHPQEGSCPGEPGLKAGDLGFVSITVTRSGIDSLQQFVDNLLNTALGNIAGPIVASLLDPILESIKAQLSALTQMVVGSAAVVVTQQSSSGGAPCPSPTATATPSPGAQQLSCTSWETVASALGLDKIGQSATIISGNGTLSCLYLPPEGFDYPGVCPNGGDVNEETNCFDVQITYSTGGSPSDAAASGNEYCHLTPMCAVFTIPGAAVNGEAAEGFDWSTIGNSGSQKDINDVTAEKNGLDVDLSAYVSIALEEHLMAIIFTQYFGS